MLFDSDVKRLQVQTFATFVIVSFACCEIASAYPTVWTLRNDSEHPVQLACKSTSAIGNVSLTMAETSLSARSEATYAWGTAFANDGLGLNKADWVCAANGKNAGTFASDWDESVSLSVQNHDGKFAVQKLSAKPPVARRLP